MILGIYSVVGYLDPWRLCKIPSTYQVYLPPAKGLIRGSPILCSITCFLSGGIVPIGTPMFGNRECFFGLHVEQIAGPFCLGFDLQSLIKQSASAAVVVGGIDSWSKLRSSVHPQRSKALVNGRSS